MSKRREPYKRKHGICIKEKKSRLRASKRKKKGRISVLNTCGERGRKRKRKDRREAKQQR
jgi:hypothetical protein